MLESELLLRLLITIIFGAILGLETETREIAQKGRKKAKKEETSRIGGVRTYTVLSLIGGVAGLLFATGETTLAYLSFIAVIILISAAYVLNVQWKHAFGMTTEVAIFITFLLGFLNTSALTSIVVNLFILVILAFFLSQKRGIGAIIEKIEHSEVIDVLKFGLIVSVILPLLPNQDYLISDFLQFLQINIEELSISKEVLDVSIINPFNMWLVVVIVSGINLGGQILKQLIGGRGGIYVIGILGGIMSSTSTTIALAQQSKKSNKVESRILAYSAIVANAVSLPSLIILVGILDVELFERVALPFLLMLVIGFSLGTFVLSREKGSRKSPNIKYQPFSITPAIKFVALITAITLLIQFAQLLNNDFITIIISAISGFVGMDAPTIAISNLAENSTITVPFAAFIIFVANAFNFGSKALIARVYGNYEFGKVLTIGLVVTGLGTLAALL